ncbi:MAG: hypothetical protein AAFQ79_15215 [Pseudomonadota bacterium]
MEHTALIATDVAFGVTILGVPMTMSSIAAFICGVALTHLVIMRTMRRNDTGSDLGQISFA